MNVERVSRFLPVCGDRWLPSVVVEAFTVEHQVPFELSSILKSLDLGSSGVERRPEHGSKACLFEGSAS